MVQKTILLTGATGCLGRAILEEGQKLDARWLPVGRQAGRPPDLGSGDWLHSDLRHLPETLVREQVAAQVCIHCAALVHKTNRSAAEFRALNTDATVALAEALAERGLERFVFVSSVAAGVEKAALTPYGASKLEAERRLNEVAERHRFRLVVIRPTTIYGRYDRGNISKLFHAISQRRYVRLIPSEIPKSLIAAEAAAATVLAAIMLQDPPRTATLADPRPYTFGEIEEALAAAAGAPLSWRLPTAPGWLGAAIGTAAERITGLSMPLSIERLRVLLRPVYVEADPQNVLVGAAHARLTGSFATRIARSYATEESSC